MSSRRAIGVVAALAALAFMAMSAHALAPLPSFPAAPSALLEMPDVDSSYTPLAASESSLSSSLSLLESGAEAEEHAFDSSLPSTAEALAAAIPAVAAHLDPHAALAIEVPDPATFLKDDVFLQQLMAQKERAHERALERAEDAVVHGTDPRAQQIRDSLNSLNELTRGGKPMPASWDVDRIAPPQPRQPKKPKKKQPVQPKQTTRPRSSSVPRGALFPSSGVPSHSARSRLHDHAPHQVQINRRFRNAAGHFEANNDWKENQRAKSRPFPHHGGHTAGLPHNKHARRTSAQASKRRRDLARTLKEGGAKKVSRSSRVQAAAKRLAKLQAQADKAGRFASPTLRRALAKAKKALARAQKKAAKRAEKKRRKAAKKKAKKAKKAKKSKKSKKSRKSKKSSKKSSKAAKKSSKSKPSKSKKSAAKKPAAKKAAAKKPKAAKSKTPSRKQALLSKAKSAMKKVGAKAKSSEQGVIAKLKAAGAKVKASARALKGKIGAKAKDVKAKAKAVKQSIKNKIKGKLGRFMSLAEVTGTSRSRARARARSGSRTNPPTVGTGVRTEMAPSVFAGGFAHVEEQRADQRAEATKLKDAQFLAAQAQADAERLRAVLKSRQDVIDAHASAKFKAHNNLHTMFGASNGVFHRLPAHPSVGRRGSMARRSWTPARRVVPQRIQHLEDQRMAARRRQWGRGDIATTYHNQLHGEALGVAAPVQQAEAASFLEVASQEQDDAPAQPRMADLPPL